MKRLPPCGSASFISSAYVECWLPVMLQTGERVDALAYVIEKGHAQYRGGLPLEEQARIIARALGGRGPNTEYLYNTVAHLAGLGIVDEDLDWLAPACPRHRSRPLRDLRL